MARSQEALARRAEKRSISVEEQRLKDRKKHKTEATPEENNSKSQQDWKCTGCQFENYASRSVCKQCSRDKNGVLVAKSPAASKKVDRSESEQKRPKSAPLTKPAPVESEPIPAIFDTNDWVCLKCNNKNFAHRVKCNRCDSPKPVCVVDASSAKATPIISSNSTPAKNVHPSGSHDGKVDTSAKKPQKKSNWGQNASSEKIEENKLLLEIIQSDKDGSSTALAQLSEEEKQRANVLLLRKQRKAEKKVKRSKLQSIQKRKSKAGDSKKK